MKNLVFSLIVLSFVSACQRNKASLKPVFGKYGDTTISAENAISARELMEMLQKEDSVQTKFKAKILETCQKKGCWMLVDMGSVDMRVKFKDYGFFVPFNSGGHDAVMEGWAYKDTISVQELRHLAKDAEASQKEIDAIVEPEVEYTFMASGVIIE